MKAHHDRSGNPTFGAGNCTRSNVIRLTRTAPDFSAIPALVETLELTEELASSCSVIPRRHLTSQSHQHWIVGRDDGIRTHTVHALNVSPAAKLGYIPIDKLVARVGFEPTRLSADDFESSKSSVPSSGVGPGGGTRTHTERSLKPLPAARLGYTRIVVNWSTRRDLNSHGTMISQ